MLFQQLSIVLCGGLATLASAQTTTKLIPSGPSPFPNSTIAATARTTLATVTTRPASSVSPSVPKATVAALGGIAAPPITVGTDPDRPFAVNGNTFDSEEEAVNRACAIQNNACADAVNSGELQDVEISDCEDQETVCINAGAP